MSSIANVIDPTLEVRDEWKSINWRKVERENFKMQKRIYQASQRGDSKTVHQLQQLYSHSWYARLLAVRKVSQDNRGKHTAGIDGVKSLQPQQRFELAKALELTGKAQPIRRVLIPKPGSEDKRPLGIPVMVDRAKQALAKLVLEPEWEAKFEANSYGFRPGRSAHDAMEAIYTSIKQKSKYVFDADIKSCFDKIDHRVLLDKMNTYKHMRHMIKAWLKATVYIDGKLFPNDEGTPQGGVISPLLANIALHGMETLVKQGFSTRKHGAKPSLVRYADDFVVLHHDLKVIKICEQRIRQWLAKQGLELKESKTRIAHTFEAISGQPGFDFLGFNIRQYPTGPKRSGHNTQGKILGYKTLIKPSKNAVKRFYAKVAEVIGNNNAVSQEILITTLNPLIRGFSNYYKSAVSKDIFAQLDHHIYQRLWVWAKRRHSCKSRYWIVNRYWHKDGGLSWSFQTSQDERSLKLYRCNQTAICRHVKVQTNRSPFDGDAIYWSQRLGRHPTLSRQKSFLLKRQQGKCAWCQRYFKDGDVMEVDHVLPTSLGGHKWHYRNLQLLHGHCHDQKSVQDGSQGRANRDVPMTEAF